MEICNMLYSAFSDKIGRRNLYLSLTFDLRSYTTSLKTGCFFFSISVSRKSAPRGTPCRPILLLFLIDRCLERFLPCTAFGDSCIMGAVMSDINDTNRFPKSSTHCFNTGCVEGELASVVGERECEVDIVGCPVVK